MDICEILLFFYNFILSRRSTRELFYKLNEVNVTLIEFDRGPVCTRLFVQIILFFPTQ